jgi:hypothetical protein
MSEAVAHVLAARSVQEALQLSIAASEEEIRSSFKRIILKIHPDKNGGTDESTRAFQHLQNLMDKASERVKGASHHQPKHETPRQEAPGSTWWSGSYDEEINDEEASCSTGLSSQEEDEEEGRSWFKTDDWDDYSARASGAPSGFGSAFSGDAWWRTASEHGSAGLGPDWQDPPENIRMAGGAPLQNAAARRTRAEFMQRAGATAFAVSAGPHSASRSQPPPANPTVVSSVELPSCSSEGEEEERGGAASSTPPPAPPSPAPPPSAAAAAATGGAAATAAASRVGPAAVASGGPGGSKRYRTEPWFLEQQQRNKFAKLAEARQREGQQFASPLTAADAGRQRVHSGLGEVGAQSRPPPPPAAPLPPTRMALPTRPIASAAGVGDEEHVMASGFVKDVGVLIGTGGHRLNALRRQYPAATIQLTNGDRRELMLRGPRRVVEELIDVLHLQVGLRIPPPPRPSAVAAAATAAAPVSPAPRPRLAGVFIHAARGVPAAVAAARAAVPTFAATAAAAARSGPPKAPAPTTAATACPASYLDAAIATHSRTTMAPKMKPPTTSGSRRVSSGHGASSRTAARSKNVKWTHAEEVALRRGVAKHDEGSWATILRDPEFCFHASRDGVKLKDKWRNMNKR